jgi:transposase
MKQGILDHIDRYFIVVRFCLFFLTCGSMMKPFTRTLKDGRVKLNAMKVRGDAKYDGKYVLRTTSDLSLSDAVAAYKILHRVEQGFRTIKSVLRIRPMYHHADHHIISHVKLCVLAYFIYDMWR